MGEKLRSATLNHQSNVPCYLWPGSPESLQPRNPRLPFEDAGHFASTIKEHQ